MQQDDRVITVGGPMTWVDLGLFALRRFCGEEVAKVTADFAVIDNTPVTQAAYAPQGFIAQQSPLLLQAESIIRAAPGRVSVAALAEELNMSSRTLARRLKQLTGETPVALINRVRLDLVRVMLESQAMPAKQAADFAGYRDESAFRRAFKQQYGRTPGEYVAWFAARQAR